MIRIIHLSDLHIRSRKNRDENRNAAALVGEIIERYKSEAKDKTVIVMTGDLVDDGKSAQYRQFRRIVLEPLEARFTVLPVPGNHDYAFWGNVFNHRAPNYFNRYVRPIPDYPDAWIDTLEPVNERKMVFIGVDSADRHDKVAFADGIVDEKQRDFVKTTLADAQYANHFKVLYVHHHPFQRDWFMAFHQASEFLNVVKRKVDLLLFGHKHVHEAFFGRYDIPAMLASGKVTKAQGDGLAFRVISVERAGLPKVTTIEVPSR
jgi:3',5'-cyclic AMP phosphodiesterase CpdA